jgi:DNA-binding transcriptional regulator YbjK
VAGQHGQAVAQYSGVALTTADERLKQKVAKGLKARPSAWYNKVQKQTVLLFCSGMLRFVLFVTHTPTFAKSLQGFSCQLLALICQ